MSGPIDGSQWIQTAVKENRVKFFDHDRLTIGDCLGDGASGKVFKGRLKGELSSIDVAVKSLQNVIIDEATHREFLKELEFLRKADSHQNISKFYGISQESITKHYLLVVQYADSGTLRNYLAASFPKINDNDKLRMAKEIARGIACLHGTGIIHRNLNSANILVHQQEIKIADLGPSNRFDESVIKPVSIHVRNLAYIEPQCFIQKRHYVRDKMSDIYSMGVVFWELTSGKVPFSKVSPSAILPQILQGTRETHIPGTPLDFVQLYTECWDTQPTARPDIQTVCTGLTGIEWDTKVASMNDTRKREEDLVIFESVMDALSKSIRAGKSWDRRCQNICKCLEDNKKDTAQFFQALDTEQNRLIYGTLLGMCHFGGVGTLQDKRRAYSAFKLSADNGDPLAAYCLGWCFNKGIGVNAYPKKAFDWYTKSAESGNSQGQCNLGWCYGNGFGTLEDREKAFHWYTESAKGGSSRGQSNLGWCYENGFGVPRDLSKAFHWFTKSAENGDSLGKSNLGHCYTNGHGIRKDLAKAFYWYTKSAEDGESMEQYSLGWCYLYGHGTEINIFEAIKWYARSAKNGGENAWLALKSIFLLSS